MPDLYRSADLLVQYEDDAGGWSDTSAEAMGCGTPLICTPYPTSDFAEHLVTSFVSERVPGAIRAAVEHLLGELELLEQLAIRGRERIQDFSRENVANQFEEMFRVLAAKSAADLAPRGSGFARLVDRWRTGA